MRHNTRGRRFEEVAAHEVAGLLNTVTDRLELVLEVLTASLGGIEVALDHHAKTAAHDAVSVAPAQARLCEARGARVRKSRGVGTVADQGEQNARIRDTPS